jgi:hypothetical protein
MLEEKAIYKVGTSSDISEQAKLTTICKGNRRRLLRTVLWSGPLTHKKKTSGIYMGKMIRVSSDHPQRVHYQQRGSWLRINGRVLLSVKLNRFRYNFIVCSLQFLHRDADFCMTFDDIIYAIGDLIFSTGDIISATKRGGKSQWAHVSQLFYRLVHSQWRHNYCNRRQHSCNRRHNWCKGL